MFDKLSTPRPRRPPRISELSEVGTTRQKRHRREHKEPKRVPKGQAPTKIKGTKGIETGEMKYIYIYIETGEIEEPKRRMVKTVPFSLQIKNQTSYYLKGSVPAQTPCSPLQKPHGFESRARPWCCSLNPKGHESREGWRDLSSGFMSLRPSLRWLILFPIISPRVKHRGDFSEMKLPTETWRATSKSPGFLRARCT